jgi:hypothetical protein
MAKKAAMFLSAFASRYNTCSLNITFQMILLLQHQRITSISGQGSTLRRKILAHFYGLEK